MDGLHIVSIVVDGINGACNHGKCKEEQDHCCIEPYKKLKERKIYGMCPEYRNHTTPKLVVRHMMTKRKPTPTFHSHIPPKGCCSL